jgi:DNA-binding PadR family transcriptional regulator
MDRRDFVLLLLGNKNNPVVGTTRFQKLAFLGEKEAGLIDVDDSFDFEPFKFGPVSKNLYDDLDFLVNLGFIDKSGEESGINKYSLDDLESLSADQFLTDNIKNEPDELHDGENIEEELKTELLDESRGGTSSSDDSIVYRITDKGMNYLENAKLIQSQDARKVQNFKNKYNNKSLKSLLYYVYTKYPNFATESEIRDDII